MISKSQSEENVQEKFFKRSYTNDTLSPSEKNFQHKFLNHQHTCDLEKEEIQSEEKFCRRRKGTKRLLLLTTLIMLGIGALFVVTLIEVDSDSGNFFVRELAWLVSVQVESLGKLEEEEAEGTI